MLVRLGELYRLGLSVARILAAHDDLNGNVLLRLPELLGRAFKGRPITSSDKLVAKFLQSLLRQEQINVFSKASIAVLIEGNGSNHVIVDAVRFQVRHKPTQRLICHSLSSQKA